MLQVDTAIHVYERSSEYQFSIQMVRNQKSQATIGKHVSPVTQSSLQMGHDCKIGAWAGLALRLLKRAAEAARIAPILVKT